MKQRDGFWFPKHDMGGHVVLSEVKDIQEAMKYVDQPEVCVQAGGYVGVYAQALSELFDAVYSFEPSPENFRCFQKNVDKPNVFKFNAALGKKPGCIEVDVELGNCGATRVNMVRKGYIPTLRLDDLNLPACDLIYLDVEGMEAAVIEGGIETIIKYHPVIVIEDKGHSLDYGYKRGHVQEFLKAYKYEVGQELHGGRDVILI